LNFREILKYLLEFAYYRLTEEDRFFYVSSLSIDLLKKRVEKLTVLLCNYLIGDGLLPPTAGKRRNSGCFAYVDAWVPFERHLNAI